MKSLRLTMPLLALLFVCCKQEENNPLHSVEVVEFKDEDSSIAGVRDNRKFDSSKKIEGNYWDLKLTEIKN